jgi:hypothetical protein
MELNVNYHLKNGLNNTKNKHMAQQTSVEWLFSQIPFEWSSSKAAFEALQQAKETEKQNIIDAWWKGREYGIRDDDAKSGEQYYNQTYQTQNT